jgi:hypothetical protein
MCRRLGQLAQKSEKSHSPKICSRPLGLGGSNMQKKNQAPAYPHSQNFPIFAPLKKLAGQFLEKTIGQNSKLSKPPFFKYADNRY